jgi:hypothetical protein
VCGLWLISIHDFLLLDAASALGKERQSGDRHGQRHFLVAGNGGRDHHAASLTLPVNETASITFGADATDAKGHEAGSTWFAAALNVATADTGLSNNEYNSREP